jgi:hypothetical protein
MPPPVEQAPPTASMPVPAPAPAASVADAPGQVPGVPVPGQGGIPPTAQQAPFGGQSAPSVAPDGTGMPPPMDPYYGDYGRVPAGGYPPRGAWYYWYEYPAIRWLAVILLVGLLALVVWLLAIRSDNSEPAAVVQPGGGPVGATEEDLVTLSQELRQPVYWAGTLPGTRMELTESNNSYAYLRYLTEDAPVGDPSPDFLTIGTYPSLDAFRNLQAYARGHPRAETARIDNRGLVVTVPGSPTSVYFAYPNQDVQVEVYDPEPKRALDLVKSGVVRPVTATASTGTVTPSPAGTTPAVPTTPTTPEGTPTITPQG